MKIKFYLRYTDDAIILSNNQDFLFSLIPIIEQWLKKERRLFLHPQKISVCKLRQGFDFLGCVILPHYTILRTKTKKRMLRLADKHNFGFLFGVVKSLPGILVRKKN